MFYQIAVCIGKLFYPACTVRLQQAAMQVFQVQNKKCLSVWLSIDRFDRCIYKSNIGI